MGCYLVIYSLWDQEIRSGLMSRGRELKRRRARSVDVRGLTNGTTRTILIPGWVKNERSEIMSEVIEWPAFMGADSFYVEGSAAVCAAVSILFGDYDESDHSV